MSHPCRHPQWGWALSTDGAVGVLIHCMEWDQMAFRDPFQLKEAQDWQDSRTWGNGLKLRQGRLRLDVRGKFFAMRVGRCWNSCPERLWMPRPSVEVLKARLDGALGSLGWYEMGRLVALPVEGGWSSMILEVPSNPSHSVIL